VGAVTYSDYPPEAAEIPRIGTYNNINIELILASRPDLVIAWKEGNQRQQVEKLMKMGLAVYVNAPSALEDIARDIRQFGILTGNRSDAERAGREFMSSLRALRRRYEGAREVSVFYQTWHRPLLTINRHQFIGQILSLCGGKNIFADLDVLSPQVSEEAVLLRNPRVIIASGMGQARPDWLDRWRQWPSLQAVRENNLLYVPPAIIQRHTPRLLEGARRVCRFLQRVRENINGDMAVPTVHGSLAQ